MGRSELREHIFRILFQIEFHDVKELEEQIELYFEQLEQIKDKDKTYIKEKYEKIFGMQDEIDGKINEAASGWKTSRMTLRSSDLQYTSCFMMKISR